MGSFGLAQISEVIAHFFIRNTEEGFCLNLNLERGKQYLGNCCRNQPSLLLSSSHHVTCKFFSIMSGNSAEITQQKDF